VEETNWIKRAGKARVTYLNGNVFEGTFDEEKRKQGEGTYTWSSSAEGEDEEGAAPKIVPSYSGNYKNGRKNGIGKMKYPNGDSYHGVWENDKKKGEGTYMYANGDVFSGTWVSDVKEGEGTYEFGVDKSQLVGLWDKGTIVSGTWKFFDGGSFEGRFIDGKPIGKGLYKFANSYGYSQAGEYTSIAPPEDAPEDAKPTLQWRGGVVESA